MAGDYIYNVYNNMIIGNVSTMRGRHLDERRAAGAGVQQHDHEERHHRHGDDLRWLGGAGWPLLARNSALLQATLPAGSPVERPLLFNNIFWDNRAGFRNGIGVSASA